MKLKLKNNCQRELLDQNWSDHRVRVGLKSDKIEEIATTCMCATNYCHEDEGRAGP